LFLHDGDQWQLSRRRQFINRRRAAVYWHWRKAVNEYLIVDRWQANVQRGWRVFGRLNRWNQYGWHFVRRREFLDERNFWYRWQHNDRWSGCRGSSRDGRLFEHGW